MFRRFAALALVALPSAAVAQEQQAGVATDTDAAFQALIDACDDTDALMLRARIRLQMPHTTEEAAASATDLMTEAFQTCSDGDPEAAKSKLAEALEIAEAGAGEAFAAGAEEATQEEASAVEVVTDDAPEESADEGTSQRWWKFW